MKNKDVKRALFETGLKMYELAELLGKSVPTVTRMFQKELSETEQETIIGLIYKEAARRRNT